jgi:hypothetical protein
MEPVFCSFGEFHRLVERNLVIEMQSCFPFPSKGLASSTSIQNHYCLPQTVALEMMNNNCHVVSAFVSRCMISNSVGGGGSLGKGQNLEVDCWSSYNFRVPGCLWSSGAEVRWWWMFCH